MKISEYIEELRAFQSEHGDLDLFSPDPTSDILGEPALIGIRPPSTAVLADAYLDGETQMVLRPGRVVAIRPANSERFPIAGKVALLAALPSR